MQLSNLPKDLALVADFSDKDGEQSIRSKNYIQYLVQHKRLLDGTENVLQVRGYNYETVSHQLSIIAETITVIYGLENDADV